MEEKLVLQNFINNAYLSTENYIDSYNPALNEVWAKVPDSDSTHVELAYKSAKQAFKSLVSHFI